MPLTAKQQRFVSEYLIDLNATQAAIRAGYSEHTAIAQASRLLTKVEVRDAVARGTRTAVERLQVTAEDITARAWVIAQQDRNDRVAALSLLAKRHPEFSEKHEHSGTVRSEVLAMVMSMSEDELRASKARLIE